MDELDELVVRSAERSRLEAEHRLELLRPVQPAEDEIPFPRRKSAGVERVLQPLLALPEVLLALPPQPSRLDLLELPGDRRHEPQ